MCFAFFTVDQESSSIFFHFGLLMAINALNPLPSKGVVVDSALNSVCFIVGSIVSSNVIV